MKKENLNEYSKPELEEKLTVLQRKLMELNFQKKTGHVEKAHLFKITKREIARILTVLNTKKQRN